MPLVAREPYWPRFRAGIGTLAAFTRLPSGRRARTLALSEYLWRHNEPIWLVVSSLRWGAFSRGKGYSSATMIELKPGSLGLSRME